MAEKKDTSETLEEPIFLVRWVANKPRLAFSIFLGIHLCSVALTLILVLTGYDLYPVKFDGMPLELRDLPWLKREQAWLNRDKYPNRVDRKLPPSNYPTWDRAFTKDWMLLFYHHNDDGNIFSKEMLRGMRKIETKLTGVDNFDSFCQMTQYGTCYPAVSVLRFFDGTFASVNPVFYDPEFDNVDKVLFAASRHNETKGAFTYALGKSHVVSEDFVSSTLTRAIIPLGWPLSGYDDDEKAMDDAMEQFLVNDLKPELDEYLEESLFQFVYFNYPLMFHDLWEQTNYDMLLVCGSLVFIFCYMFFHTGSLWVTAFAEFSIVCSFVEANLIYRTLIGFRYFGFFHVLGMFIILGIGADDLFVFWDSWTATSLTKYPSLAHRLHAAYRKSMMSMFVTSITTMTAFLANSLSPLLATKSFGVFASVLVAIDYMAVITFFPCVVICYHIYFEDKGPGCCCCCWRRTDDSLAEEEEEVVEVSKALVSKSICQDNSRTAALLQKECYNGIPLDKSSSRFNLNKDDTCQGSDANGQLAYNRKSSSHIVFHGGQNTEADGAREEMDAPPSKFITDNNSGTAELQKPGWNNDRQHSKGYRRTAALAVDGSPNLQKNDTSASNFIMDNSSRTALSDTDWDDLRQPSRNNDTSNDKQTQTDQILSSDKSTSVMSVWPFSPGSNRNDLTRNKKGDGNRRKPMRPIKLSISVLVIFFREDYFYAVTHKYFRWVIIALLLGCIAGFAYCAAFLKPDNEQVRVYTDSHHYSKAIDFYDHGFVPNDVDLSVTLYLVWGLQESDLSQCDHSDFACEGVHSHDESFDISTEAAQRAMLKLCQTMSNFTEEEVKQYAIKRDLLTGRLEIACFPLSMEHFLKKEAKSSHADVTMPWNWEKTSAFMTSHSEFYNTSAFNTSFTRYMDIPMTYWLWDGFKRTNTPDFQAFNHLIGEETDTFSTKILTDSAVTTGNRIRYAAISINTTMRLSMGYEEGIPVVEKWEEFMKEQLSQMPPELKGGFQVTEHTWHWLHSQQTLAHNAVIGMGIGLALAFPVLVVATCNIINGLLATLTICCVTVCVIGVIPFGGWNLGVLVSMNMSLVVGLAVDFVVHLAEAYHSSQYTDRHSKLQNALERMGVSVFSGACTTLGASLFMLFAKIQFFFQFGIFMFSTIGFSLIFSMGLYVTVMGIVGPEGDVGDIRVLFRKCCACIKSGGGRRRGSSRRDSLRAAERLSEGPPLKETII